MRPIDADAAKLDVKDFAVTSNPAMNRFNKMFVDLHNKELDNQPTIDAVPVVHGHWIGLEYDGYADGYPVYDVWECSICGNEIEGEDTPRYCCDCGAKMDEVE